MKIYVLVQFDFDNMENHCPEHSKPVAAFTTPEEADAYIAAHPPTYKGYDRSGYPVFVRHEVPLDPAR